MPTNGSTHDAEMANPTTPAYPDDIQWVTAYLVIHMLSPGSFWYAYLLWILIGCIFLFFAALHWTRLRGGFLGAHWRKWTIRRRTWRGAHAIAEAARKGRRPQLSSFHSNSQILALVAICIGTILLCFAGPDHSARSVPTVFQRAAIFLRAPKSYDITPFLSLQPQYQISKAWWTSGNRVGLIAFALLPLCVLFALKAPPFAVFAISFTTQIYFDKLSWLHRWAGRLIWLLSALHVVFWSVQLAIDRRTDTDTIAYAYVWQYQKFRFGWTAFIAMTALIGLSSSPLRKRYYELFYALHVLLVPLTIIMAALHHPPVWWWCWIALGLWIGERIWRAIWWLHLNGFLGHSPTKSAYFLPPRNTNTSAPTADLYPPTPKASSPFIADDFRESGPLSLPAGRYMPPPGFAYAELLYGATVRLTFVPSGFVSWAPGQHFLINIPSISRLTSHPFTVASVCDEQAPSEAGRALVFLVRAKSGWTKQLWDRVLSMLSRGETHVSSEAIPDSALLPTTGVLMKMYLDGPFGSAIRAPWQDYSTLLIIVGGSGASFGMSVLQFACLCLAGRDGGLLGGHSGGWGSKRFKMRRVRFLWIIREYAHAQWCASIIRRCMTIMPAPSLEVDIFVTSPIPAIEAEAELTSPPDDEKPHISPSDDLRAPSPFFMASPGYRSRSGSVDSISSSRCHFDPNPNVAHFGDADSDDENGLQELYTLYLTNFEGDMDISLPGEAALNKRIRSKGKILRAKSRKAKQVWGAHPPSIPQASTYGSSAARAPHGAPTLPSRERPDTPMSSTLHLPGQFAAQLNNGEAPIQVRIDPYEMEDMSFVSEHIRQGKPKFDRILEDEVQMAQGPLIVATCGPTSLDAMIRKAISKQIDPARIWKGDMRGFIDLVSEDFDY